MTGFANIIWFRLTNLQLRTGYSTFNVDTCLHSQPFLDPDQILVKANKLRYLECVQGVGMCGK